MRQTLVFWQYLIKVLSAVSHVALRNDKRTVRKRTRTRKLREQRMEAYLSGWFSPLDLWTLRISLLSL
jgi:hypothetical protein